MNFHWNESRELLQSTLHHINATRGKGTLRDISALMGDPNNGVARIQLQFGWTKRKFRISKDGRKVTFCGTTRVIGKES